FDARIPGCCGALRPHCTQLIRAARCGVDEDKTVDHLWPAGCEMLRDKAAERNPGDMRTRDIVPDEQFGELVRQVFDRVGAARNRRAPGTRQIIRYQREVFSEPSAKSQKWWSTPRQCSKTRGRPAPCRFSAIESVSSLVMP